MSFESWSSDWKITKKKLKSQEKTLNDELSRIEENKWLFFLLFGTTTREGGIYDLIF